VDVYDPVKRAFINLSNKHMLLPRRNHVSVALDDTRILLVGGAAGAANDKQAEIWRFDNGTFVQQQLAGEEAAKWSLSVSRTVAYGALVTRGPTAGLMIIGRDEQATITQDNVIDWFPVTGPRPIADMQVEPNVRMDGCAVPTSNGLVAIAGRPSATGSSATSTLYSLGDGGKVRIEDGPVLPEARFNQSCAVLPGGAILVTGGENNGAVLKDALIFQP